MTVSRNARNVLGVTMSRHEGRRSIAAIIITVLVSRRNLNIKQRGLGSIGSDKIRTGFNIEIYLFRNVPSAVSRDSIDFTCEQIGCNPITRHCHYVVIMRTNCGGKREYYARSFGTRNVFRKMNVFQSVCDVCIISTGRK